MSFLTNVVKVLEALGIKNKAFNDKRYVNTAGDTVTGGLTIQPTTDTLTGLVVNDKDANRVLTVDTVNNRVGIGTTNPEQELDIVGDIRLSGEILGTNTTYTRLNVANGAGGQAYDISASTRTSTGASTERLRITGGTDVGVVSISNSYLGIGTTAPTLAKLQIEAGKGIVGQYIKGGTTTGTDLLRLRANAATQRLILEGARGIVKTFLEAGGSIGLFGTVTNHDFRIRTNYVDRMTFDTSGNVGIGTSTPTAKLQINSIDSYESATLGTELLSASNWTLGTGWSGDFDTGFTHTSGTANLSNTLAGVINNYYQITYTVTGRTAGSFTITFGDESYSGRTATGTFGPRATTTGNLIITPTTNFNGTIVVSIKQITANYGATFALNDSTGASSFEIRNSLASLGNTFIGINSGRRNTTGINNSSLGYNSLLNNTTGNNNSTQGAYALYSNSTGSNNSAQGYSALRSNTTGGSNSAQGANALYLNTTGSYNSAQGYNAFYNLTGDSNNNTAIGYNSGSYYNGTTGNLTSVSNSIFLGASTSALSDNSSNEIVIGYNAIGLGSNTIKLGNTSITNVASNGDFEALDIGDGFILKSPDGTRYRITVANGGALSAVAV